MKHSVLLSCWSLALAPLLAFATLEDDFRSPPVAARPQVWWHWMSGNITREGITADLEAMRRIGLGGTHLFNLSYGEASGPVKLLGADWYGLMQYTFREAERLGLEIAVHGCPGWSESGGPWVPPQYAMQEITRSTLGVKGPGHFRGALPIPSSRNGYYRDIAVFAVPADSAEPPPLASLHPRLSGSLPTDELAKAVDGCSDTIAWFPLPTTNVPDILQLEFADPVSIGSARLRTVTFPEYPWASELQVSDDGQHFRRIAVFPSALSPSVSFTPVRTKFLRLVITRSHFFLARRIGIEDLELGGSRLEQFEQKAALVPGRLNPISRVATRPAPMRIPWNRVIELTDRLDATGQLDWEVPQGAWTILRLGHTPTGMINKPAPLEGTGLECDKLNGTAVGVFFDGLMDRLIRDAGPRAGRTLKMMLLDSWEAGCQNWTPNMRGEFRRLRGYDPQPWLPTLVGCVVGSVEETERFLWDFRRTIADLVAENHYAVLRDRLHHHDMQLIAEAVGMMGGIPTVADQFQCKGRTDIPMGEFWLNGQQDVKGAAAAAHVYGKPIVAAESFTAHPEMAGWRSDPFSLKALGDYAFCLGVNQIVIQSCPHQPWMNRRPGMTMGPWGTNFERTQTWWEQSSAWIGYLSRCQFLLQQGRFVGDLCYYVGEGAPIDLPARAALKPVPPVGYDYDGCGAEVLLTRMAVRDGRIELPDGTQYKALVLPATERMTPAIARKIRELVKAGAVVIGPRPAASPSLFGYPGCDDEVRRIAEEVWGPLGDGGGKVLEERSFGQGRVFSGGTLPEIFAKLNVPPDFSWTGASTNASIAYIHRIAGDTDLYFVCNQQDRVDTIRASFRVVGRRPEFWYPDTGHIEPVPAWAMEAGRTIVPIPFDPCGSVFVVFREPVGSVDPLVPSSIDSASAELIGGEGGKVLLRAWRNGTWSDRTASGRERKALAAGLLPPVELSGPWMLSFPPGLGAPQAVVFDALVSWAARPEEGVKHFSGTATYVREFTLPAERLGDGLELHLDLGWVKNIAEVSLNGRSLGILWKPPFRTDITAAAQAGKNRLEIRVTNLWPNRLIGDLAKPEAERITWTTLNPYTPNSPLLESGLLGPVVLRSARLVEWSSTIKRRKL